jgi:hypothetical protein
MEFKRWREPAAPICLLTVDTVGLDVHAAIDLTVEPDDESLDGDIEVAGRCVRITCRARSGNARAPPTPFSRCACGTVPMPSSERLAHFIVTIF